MNTRVIIAGTAVLSVVAGFAGGYLLGDSRGRKDAWEKAADELDATEDRLKKRYKVGEYASSDFFSGGEGEGPAPQVGVKEKVDAADLERLREHIEAGGYAQLKPGETLFEKFENEDEVTVEILDVDPGVTPNMDDAEPYTITEAEFNHDEETYSKISLSWYPTDRVLANERDEQVGDVETTVGIQNLNHFSEGKRTIWIRNDRLEADFEIVLEPGSYAETVLGIEPEPIEERPRRKSRPKVDRDE